MLENILFYIQKIPNLEDFLLWNRKGRLSTENIKRLGVFLRLSTKLQTLQLKSLYIDYDEYILIDFFKQISKL